MANFTVKDIPDEMYQRFKTAAERDRRSVNAEILEAMDQLIQTTELRDQRMAALERITERRRSLPMNAVDSLALLHESREEG